MPMPLPQLLLFCRHFVPNTNTRTVMFDYCCHSVPIQWISMCSAKSISCVEAVFSVAWAKHRERRQLVYAYCQIANCQKKETHRNFWITIQRCHCHVETAIFFIASSHSRWCRIQTANRWRWTLEHTVRFIADWFKKENENSNMEMAETCLTIHFTCIPVGAPRVAISRASRMIRLIIIVAFARWYISRHL